MKIFNSLISRKSKRVVERKWPLADLVAALVLFHASALATDSRVTSNPNDEGLTRDAVIYRQIGKPTSPYFSPLRMVSSVPLLFDDKDRSNQLVITLNYNNSSALQRLLPTLQDAASRSASEATVLEAVRSKTAETIAGLGQPVAAWYLTDGNRMDDTQRSKLSYDHPREKLEQYLVLRYDSVTNALESQLRLVENSAIATVSNDRRVSISFSPNDPYYQIALSPVNYRWGLDVMNFSSAWDTTLGNAYIGIIEPGVPTNLSTLPNDSHGNHRMQFAYATPPEDPLHPTTEPVEFNFGSTRYHAEHALGIIGATANNGIGIAGACPSCNTALL